MTNPSPMDHIRMIETITDQAKADSFAGTTASRRHAALEWALPLLRAIYEPPSSNPHVTSHIRVLEDFLPESTPTRDLSAQEVNESIRWALPILRAYAIRKMTTPPTKNTPGSNVHNLRLLATGESVAWDLVETALDWALPILEASMALPIESIRRATDLELAADELAGNSTPSPAAMSTIRKCMRQAAAMLRVPAPNNSRYSAENRREVVEFLKAAASDMKMPLTVARFYERAAAIISEHLTSTGANAEIDRLREFMTAHMATHHQAWEVSETPVDVAIRLLSMKSTESMAEHADKLRKIANDLTGNSTKIRDALREAAMILQGLGISFEELAKLESFIEEKFPGELNGNGPATVAIRLLREHPGLTTKAARLPTLDASQIPVTRDLALEVLRNFFASMQWSYPYAPTLTPEQWATTREALMFLLAYNPEDHSPLFSERKKANESLSKVTGQRNQAWAELREIQGIIGLNLNESPIEAAKRVSSKLKVTIAEAERYQSYWNASATRLTETMAILGIEAPFPETSKLRSAIEAKWFKKCRPGTMNMMPVRCDACTAPAGTIHLPIPEAPPSQDKIDLDLAHEEIRKLQGVLGSMPELTADAMSPGERTLRDQYLNQRDAAWKELREIREAIGANPEESTLDEVKSWMTKSESREARMAQDRDKIDSYLGQVMRILGFSAPWPAIDNMRTMLGSKRASIGRLGTVQEAAMKALLRSTLIHARDGIKPRRKQLAKLAEAIGWALTKLAHTP